MDARRRPGVRDADDRYRLTFAVENLFDTNYAYFIVGNIPQFGHFTQFVGNERWFSVNLSASFG